MSRRRIPAAGMRSTVVLIAAVTIASCGDRAGDRGSAPGWVGGVGEAVAAVEAELGDGQEYFEVTATPQLTNVFVAVESGTAAIPYVYVDGALGDPAPRLDGAAGQTFTADQIDLDEARVLDQVERDLPAAVIDALSVEGGPAGTVRYLVAARSAQGGVLDIEVASDGTILAVDAR